MPSCTTAARPVQLQHWQRWTAQWCARGGDSVGFGFLGRKWGSATDGRLARMLSLFLPFVSDWLRCNMLLVWQLSPAQALSAPACCTGSMGVMSPTAILRQPGVCHQP